MSLHLPWLHMPCEHWGVRYLFNSSQELHGAQTCAPCTELPVQLLFPTSRYTHTPLVTNGACDLRLKSLLRSTHHHTAPYPHGASSHLRNAHKAQEASGMGQKQHSPRRCFSLARLECQALPNHVGHATDLNSRHAPSYFPTIYYRQHSLCGRCLQANRAG